MSRRSVAATKSQNCRPYPTYPLYFQCQSTVVIWVISPLHQFFIIFNIVDFVRWMLNNQHSIKPIWKRFSKAIQQNVKLTWSHYYPPDTPHTKTAMPTGILNLIKIKGLLSNVSLKAKQNINIDTKVLSLMVQSLQCYRQKLYFEFLESLLWKQYPFYCYLHIASVKTCTYDKSDSLIMIIDNAKYRWKKHSSDIVL